LWGHAGGADYESEDDHELAFFTYWLLVRLACTDELRAADEVGGDAAGYFRLLAAPLALAGTRLRENDNWIAGFCRHYREPIISLDAAFDRVSGIRRLAY